MSACSHHQVAAVLLKASSASARPCGHPQTSTTTHTKAAQPHHVFLEGIETGGRHRGVIPATHRHVVAAEKGESQAKKGVVKGAVGAPCFHTLRIAIRLLAPCRLF